MLTLELAVMLPATALIWARKKVEAGIHRDFQTMKGAAMYSRDGEGKFLRAAESL